MKSIKHVWFDFTDTLAAIDKNKFEQMVYGAYANATKKPVTPELTAEYKALLAEHKSNAAVLATVGISKQTIADMVNINVSLYRLTDPDIPSVLEEMKRSVPISVFSNSPLQVMLPALGIKPELFSHILGPNDVSKPKPDPEGFQKMIELSGVPAHEILYIGDDVEKDLLPAKRLGMKTGLMWETSQEADYCLKDFKSILLLVSNSHD